MQQVSGFQCVNCKSIKSQDCFMLKKDGLSYYDTCTECWRKKSVLFWSTKHFRVCKKCEEKLALRHFGRDGHGLPYAHCNECHEAHVAEDYRKIRDAKRQTEAVSFREEVCVPHNMSAQTNSNATSSVKKL